MGISRAAGPAELADAEPVDRDFDFKTTGFARSRLAAPSCGTSDPEGSFKSRFSAVLLSSSLGLHSFLTLGMVNKGGEIGTSVAMTQLL